jgi:hypothetical protein
MVSQPWKKNTLEHLEESGGLFINLKDSVTINEMLLDEG